MATCNYSLIDKYPQIDRLSRAFFEFSCPEQSYGDSKSCILHHDFPKDDAPDFEVIKRHKKQKVDEKEDSGDFNFIGARIYEIDGAGRQDIDNVDLTDAEIRGNVDFKGAHIRGGVRIVDAAIEGDLSFDGATISGFVAIYRVKEGPAIGGDFSFTGATLPASWFDRLEIRKDVSFDRATIVGNAYFRGIIVKGSVWFNDATVNGAVLFESAEIDGNMWVEGTDRISGELSFQGATFKRPRSEESACRAAKQNCERRGVRQDADEYFYREMAARRRQSSQPVRFLEWLFIDCALKYGTSPKRLVITWASVAFILGGFTFFASGMLANSWQLENIGFGAAAAFAPGFALVQPPISVIVAIIEAMVSAFLWAAFIVVFSRKYMR